MLDVVQDYCTISTSNKRKGKIEKENYRRAAISIQINVLRLKHYYSVVKSLQDDFDDHESGSNRYSFYIIFFVNFTL